MDQFSEKNAAELISSFVNSIGAGDDSGLIPFFQSWRQFVGTDLAAHSQIEDLRNGALIVRVDHPAWLQRLHIDKDRILKRMTSKYPNLDLRYMHFYVGTLETTVASDDYRRDDGGTSGEPTDGNPAAGGLSAAGETTSSGRSGGPLPPDSETRVSGSREDGVPSELQERFERLKHALEEKERANRAKKRDN